MSYPPHNGIRRVPNPMGSYRVVIDERVIDLLRARLIQANRLYPRTLLGFPYTWQNIPVSEHVAHAEAHLALWNGGQKQWEDDHLVHAFARLYCALALQLEKDAESQ